MSPDGPRPTFRELVDWVEDRLDPPGAERVAAWVDSGDAQARGTVEWLRGFVETARSVPLHDPPPIVRQSLNQHFAAWAAEREAPRRPVRELVARLLFDSRQDLALAGARAGDDTSEAVHLAFTTEVADLVVDVHPSGGGRVRLEGQVLAGEPAGAPVFEASLEGEAFSARTVDGDALGRFCLEDVPAGSHELRATNGEIAIVATVVVEG